MINQGIELLVPKLVVILHYVELILKISYGKKEVNSRYHLGSGIYVTCAFQYRNVCVRYWKTANGKRYPTLEGISFKFNEWNEFINVAQRMYTEYSKCILVNPVFRMKIDLDMI